MNYSVFFDKFMVWVVSDTSGFTPKFIFDHLRNVGLSAILLSVGYVLAFNLIHKGIFTFFPNVITGYFLLFIAISLAFINSIQFVIVAASSCPDISNKWILNIVVIAITIWSQILMYGVLYTQFFTLIEKYNELIKYSA